MLKVVEKRAAREASREFLPLDEIALARAPADADGALKAEADDYVERHRDERDERGTRAGGAQRPGPRGAS